MTLYHWSEYTYVRFSVGWINTILDLSPNVAAIQTMIRVHGNQSNHSLVSKVSARDNADSCRSLMRVAISYTTWHPCQSPFFILIFQYCIVTT